MPAGIAVHAGRQAPARTTWQEGHLEQGLLSLASADMIQPDSGRSLNFRNVEVGMRTRVATIGTLAVLLLGQVGCVSKTPGASDANNGSVSGQQAQATASATETEVPGLISLETQVTATEIAPPYFEIRQRVGEIVNPTDPGAGPIVNDDGIADPDIRKAFSDYQQSLLGKRIDQWEGWVLSYTSTDLDNPQTNYNIGIAMQEPGPGKDVPTHVFAFDYPRERLKPLKMWQEIEQDPEKGFGSCGAGWDCQRIIFSGTLGGLQEDGRVYIEDMVIEVLD
jgi:hypothetical protein